MASLSYVILFLYTLILQTLANSDISTDGIIASSSSSSSTKSDDMPASIVFLLLLIFTSLGFICIRHIRKEYDQQQTYLKAKQNGTILNHGISSKSSYGSIFAPNLNRNNIDSYIDDSLYGNNAIIERINHYRRSIQQRIIDYMEQTPEPVTFEANPDKTVGPYCKTNKHCKSPSTSSKPIQHSTNYDPTPSPALQRMFNSNYQKCTEQQNQQNTHNENKENEEEKEEYLSKDIDKNNNINKMRVSLKNRINNEDFDNYDDYGGDHDNDNDGNNDYDVIPENHAYSDSDNNLSDCDNGQNIKQNGNDSPLLTKVVVLDLD